MIKRGLLIIFTLLFIQNLFSQYRKFNNPIWTIGTAKTVQKKELHLNLLYYSQYGITQNIELQSKPLWWIKNPHFLVKINWKNFKGQRSKNFFKKLNIFIASRHGLYYPTPLMNYANEKKIFNINYTNKVNSLIALKNELIFSFLIKKNKGCYLKNSIVTINFGNHFSFLNKSSDYLLIEKSVFFTRTSFFEDKSLWYIGLGYDSKLSYGLNYSFDLNFYSLGIDFENWITEHKGYGYWYWGRRNRIRPSIGYILSFNNHPDSRLNFYPFFDITLLFKIKKSKKNNNLFDNGVIEETDEDDRLYDY